MYYEAKIDMAFCISEENTLLVKIHLDDFEDEDDALKFITPIKRSILYPDGKIEFINVIGKIITNNYKQIISCTQVDNDYQSVDFDIASIEKCITLEKLFHTIRKPVYYHKD